MQQPQRLQTCILHVMLPVQQACAKTICHQAAPTCQLCLSIISRFCERQHHRKQLQMDIPMPACCSRITAHTDALGQVQQSFCFNRIGRNGYELDRELSAALLQLMPTLNQAQLQGPLGTALLASLSTDPALQQALLQGLCLFTVASTRAGTAGTACQTGIAGPGSKTTLAGRALLNGKAGVAHSEMEAHASAVAAAIKDSLVKAVEQVSAAAIAAQVMGSACITRTCTRDACC